MSTLKVNKLRDTAGSADAIVLDPNGGAVLAGVTTVTSVKVGAAVTISESGIEASGIGITCASINGTQIGGRRNIVINGAMNVAQRGTSFSGTAQQYTLDRMQMNTAGNDEIAQTSQASVTSGGAYNSGFRNCLKITNGDQTSVGTSDVVHLKMVLEAQDIAKSGWNYTSSSSFVTLSFWIKSSVAQDFTITLRSEDGTRQVYNMKTGSLTADTWTKVTKTIPGNSNLQFDDDVNAGLTLFINAFVGTDLTTTGLTQNAWSAWSSAKQGDDMTNTWYDTNNATLEITGIQLEVGSQATPFEHRSFAEELTLCQRYFQLHNNIMTAGYVPDNTARVYALGFNYPVQMRDAPTLSITQTGSTSHQAVVDASSGANITSILSSSITKFCAEYSVNLDADLTNFRPAITESPASSTRATDYKFNAEL